MPTLRPPLLVNTATTWQKQLKQLQRQRGIAATRASGVDFIGFFRTEFFCFLFLLLRISSIFYFPKKRPWEPVVPQQGAFVAEKKPSKIWCVHTLANLNCPREDVLRLLVLDQ